LDVVRAKANWVERDREDVKRWLKTNGYYSQDLETKE
jgi:aminopeptidase 2